MHRARVVAWTVLAVLLAVLRAARPAPTSPGPEPPAPSGPSRPAGPARRLGGALALVPFVAGGAALYAAVALYGGSDLGTPEAVDPGTLCLVVSEPRTTITPYLTFRDDTPEIAMADFDRPPFRDLPGLVTILRLRLQGPAGATVRYVLDDPKHLVQRPTQQITYGSPAGMILDDDPRRVARLAGGTVFLTRTVGSESASGGLVRSSLIVGTVPLDDRGRADVALGGTAADSLHRTQGARTAVAVPTLSGCPLPELIGVEPVAPGTVTFTGLEDDAPAQPRPVDDPNLRGTWHVPAITGAEIEIGRAALARQVTFADPPLTEPGHLRWTDPASPPRYLVIDEAGGRRAQRDVFVSGALVGVAGGLLIEGLTSTTTSLRRRLRPSDRE